MSELKVLFVRELEHPDIGACAEAGERMRQDVHV
jgi:hypothetical protein